MELSPASFATRLLSSPILSFKITRARTLSLNGQRITNLPRQIDLLSPNELDTLPKPLYVDVAFWARVQAEILAIETAKLPDPNAPLDVSSLKIDGIPLTEYDFIFNKENRRKSFLRHRDTKIASPYELATIQCRLESLGKGTYNQYEAEFAKGYYFRYSPQKPEIYRDGEDDYFNTYSPPSWLSGWSTPKEVCRPPAWFADFMIHLCPQKSQRRELLSVCRDTVFSRADPVTVLVGAPGIGKGILVDHILNAMVGAKNIKKASRSFNGNKFHDGMVNSRLFFGDEIAITEASKENLKDYHSKFAAIEEKHAPVGAPREMHASIFISNNYEDKISLDYSDRKFFIPYLTKELFSPLKAEPIL